MTYQEKLLAIKNGLLPRECVPKPKKYLNKVSEKKKKEIAEQKGAGSDSELDLFFTAMRKRCTGKCFFCGDKTMVKHESMWRIAIAHLAPKSKFKSIATNEDNWVELCWQCHTNFDNGKISWELLKDSAEWSVLKEKLLNILPMVAPEETKNKLYSKLTSLVYGK